VRNAYKGVRRDNWQLSPLARVGDAIDNRGAAERDAVKEAQGTDGNIEARPRYASRPEVDLVSPDFRSAFNA
jgi:hypothetical protein